MAKSDEKLKPADVLEIRKLLEQGVPNVVLANKYGVSKQTICDLKAGRSWKNLHADEDGKPYFTHRHQFVPNRTRQQLVCTCGEAKPWRT